LDIEMKKLILFLAIINIILLLAVGLSACGKAVTSTQPPSEQVSSVTETPTPTEPETPTTPSVGVQVVLAEIFTGDW
jgi:hypothetical protein